MVKRWEKETRCPYCGKRLPEDKEVEDHLNKILDTIRESAPDVSSEDEMKTVLDPDND